MSFATNDPVDPSFQKCTVVMYNISIRENYSKGIRTLSVLSLQFLHKSNILKSKGHLKHKRQPSADQPLEQVQLLYVSGENVKW